jgi:hypothetical protein
MAAPYLTPLFSDNFTRANVSPLTSPWAIDTAGEASLQIVSDFCQNVGGANSQGVQLYNETLPNDQYASATVGATFPSAAALNIMARTTQNAIPFFSTNWPGYKLSIYGSNAYLYCSTGGLLGFVPIVPGVSIGDTFTIAIVGTTVYLLHNSTQLAAVTNTSVSSGGSALATATDNSGNAVKVSSFVVGSASATPPGDPLDDPTLIYLGQVVVVGSAPAGDSSPYLGHVHVITNPRAGASNPYLGKVTVLGAAPAGNTDPLLGEVVVVGSVPAGEADVYLGSVTET